MRFGVQTVNPLDPVAAFQPASSAQDVQIPQGMFWAGANLTEEVAIEGDYQYEWDPVRTPPLGWFFSDNDTIGAERRRDGRRGPLLRSGHRPRRVLPSATQDRSATAKTA